MANRTPWCKAHAALPFLAGFTLLMILVGASDVDAQDLTQGNTLTSKYRISNAGFEIELPDSWNGMQVDGTRAIFTPSDSQDAFITILVVDRLDTEKFLRHGIDAVSAPDDTQSFDSDTGGYTSLLPTPGTVTITEPVEGQTVDPAGFIVRGTTTGDVTWVQVDVRAIGSLEGMGYVLAETKDDWRTWSAFVSSDNPQYVRVIARATGYDALEDFDRVIVNYSGSERLAAESRPCRSNEIEVVALNDFEVLHSAFECPRPGSYVKIETYIFFTLSKTVVVSLSAGSAEAFDRYSATFESSVQDSTLNEPIDVRSMLKIILGTTGIWKTHLTLDAAESEVSLVTATSSRILNVTLDEDSRRVTIFLRETTGSEGSLLVPIGSILRGPYQVYVNGEPHDDILLIRDMGTGDQLLNVWYGKGNNEIEIVGMEVVPEFGGGIAIILFTALSIVVLQRLRLLHCG